MVFYRKLEVELKIAVALTQDSIRSGRYAELEPEEDSEEDEIEE